MQGRPFGILSGARWFFVAASISSIGFAVFSLPEAGVFRLACSSGTGICSRRWPWEMLLTGYARGQSQISSVSDIFPAVFNVADFWNSRGFLCVGNCIDHLFTEDELVK